MWIVRWKNRIARRPPGAAGAGKLVGDLSVPAPGNPLSCSSGLLKSSWARPWERRLSRSRPA